MPSTPSYSSSGSRQRTRQSTVHIPSMSFAKRLVTIRKSRSLTQSQLSKITGIYVSMIKRYEQGDGEPSLAILRKLSKGLNVAADELLFEEGEREPKDDFLYEFEAIDSFDEESKETARQLLHALIQQQQSKKLLQRAKDM